MPTFIERRRRLARWTRFSGGCHVVFCHIVSRLRKKSRCRRRAARAHQRTHRAGHGKIFRWGYSGHATVTRDGFGFRTECAIHLDSKVTLQAEGHASDAYASGDQAALRVEKRLRRYHRRLKDHRADRSEGYSGGLAEGHPEQPAAAEAASYVIAAPETDGEAELDGFTPVIIAESTTRLKHLSVSDAVMELDMTGAPVLVFRHVAHGGINVVYRRADGHFGWIDAPAAAAADAH